MRLISWNVNGIRAVYRKDAFFPLFKNSPDIVCTQETKAHPDQLPDDLKNVPGYYSYFSSAEKKGYSGVGIWTKEKPKKVTYGLGKKEFDSEGRTIIAEYKKFTLLNVYFPNGCRDSERLEYKMKFYDLFLKKINARVKKGEKIVFCGDVNTAHAEIDLARPKENRNSSGFLDMERQWIDKVIKAGYSDSFRMFNDKGGHYTWWDMITRARERDVGWRIDYFFVSDKVKKKVKSAGIMKKTMGSDHCPVTLELEL